MEIFFFFFFHCLRLNIHGKFNCSNHYRQVNTCSHFVNNCELVALDKDLSFHVAFLKWNTVQFYIKHLNHGWVDNCEISTASEIPIKLKLI